MMNDLKTNPWILAARPKTILASIGPVLIGLSIAFHLSQKINTTIALLTLICAILLQIGTNIANDYLDFKKGVDTLERLGPVRVTSKGLISEDKMKKALILILSSAFLCGIYLMIHGGPFIMAIGLLSLYFSYGYTGGPFPLSYNGLGELAALLFFGPIAVVGTTYLQTHQFDYYSITLGIGVGLISAAILAVNNLRDIVSDSKLGKKTIAVIFGEKFQRRLIIFLSLMAAFISMSLGIFIKNYLLFSPLILFFLFHSNWKEILYQPITSLLNNNLANTAKYLFIYSILTSISLVILK
jgi:1,4-dihydroxy-2-naphthoate octaprenyltransferase